MNYLLNLMKTTFENSLDKKDVAYVYVGKPDIGLSKQVLEKGIIYIEPISTEVMSLTTGIRDQESKQVKVVLAKNVLNKFNKNAQRESGQQFLMRVMEGQNDNNSLVTSSLRYIIRSNFHVWGVQQNDMNIEYMTNEIDDIAEGTVTGTITFTQIDSVIQPLLP